MIALLIDPSTALSPLNKRWRGHINFSSVSSIYSACRLCAGGL